MMENEFKIGDVVTHEEKYSTVTTYLVYHITDQWGMRILNTKNLDELPYHIKHGSGVDSKLFRFVRHLSKLEYLIYFGKEENDEV